MPYSRDNLSEVKSDWAVTDNTTLTDAGITFAALQDGRYPDSHNKFVNWLSFLESVVLHDVTLADDRIFSKQPWIQSLRSKIGESIDGLDLGEDVRASIKKDVRSFADSLKPSLVSQIECLRLPLEKTKGQTAEQVFARANSDLHRSLFYVCLASAVSLPYRPAYSRERVFAATVPQGSDAFPMRPKDMEAELASSLLNRVLVSAGNYVAKVGNLGGPRMAVAKLPPIAVLVIAEARRTGSWSEALSNLRNSRGVRGFRKWVGNVVECLVSGDGSGIRKLEEANQFVDGWAVNPGEGIKYKTRSIGIGNFHSMMEFSLKYKFRDPVLSSPSHLVFLSRVFKDSLLLNTQMDPRGIAM